MFDGGYNLFIELPETHPKFIPAKRAISHAKAIEAVRLKLEKGE